MDGQHSVSWVRGTDTPQLATVALSAESWLEEFADRPDDYHAHWSALARETRRQALDELQRRGEIKSYSFV